MAKRRLSKAEQEAFERERMNATVRMDGVGEAPIVKDILSEKFINANDSQATEMALLLQQLIRGQNSILENQNKLSEDLEKLREKQAKYDEAARKWDEDQIKFKNEVLDKARSLKVSGSEKDKIIATASQQLQGEITKVKAQQVSDRLMFDQALARQPKYTVTSPGVAITVTENGTLVQKVMMEEVRIKHRVWQLPINTPVEVPEAVYLALQNRRKAEEENRARQGMMRKNLEASEFRKEWKQIDEKFGSPTDSMRGG